MLKKVLLIYYNNKLAIAIIRNLVEHNLTKHIAIKYHYARDAMIEGTINLIRFSSSDQVIDLMTKAL